MVDFTIPYVISGTVLVARDKDHRFSQLTNIAGHKVGVGQGTTFETVGLPLHITSPAFTVEVVAITVKKGNKGFVDELNQILSAMKADGT